MTKSKHPTCDRCNQAMIFACREDEGDAVERQIFQCKACCTVVEVLVPIERASSAATCDC